MRRHTEGRATLDIPGATVSDVFAGLVATYPAVAGQLRDSEGRILRHVNVFVNGDDIRDLDGESTPLNDRDEVQVIPAMAGG
jgi:molybdopterin converting factor small subunit